MPTTWIVSGDSSRARILQVTGRNRLAEIQDFLNPKGRADDRELITDAHPRFSGHGGVGRPGARSTGGPLIRKNLDKEVEKLVGDEIDRDLSWFDAREIDRFLKGDGTPVKYP